MSNCKELSKYFLDEHFKKDLNFKNPNGTRGRLALEYAILLNEMWNQKKSYVSPEKFKLILGEYAT